MEKERTLSAIEKTISFWRGQDIPIIPKAIEEIRHLNQTKALHLPHDFIELYRRANGIPFPPESDAEGFTFYPVETIVSAREELGADAPLGKRKIYIFSDYLVKCWFYGYEVMDDGSYTIGIIPADYKFKVITKSLTEFLELYMVDSETLYDYGSLDEGDKI